MEIKIVKLPVQDDSTQEEQSDLIGHKWIVKSNRYREGDGGLNQWYDYIKKTNCDIVYLYEIKATLEKICNGEINGEMQYITDMVYWVRADYKKIN